LTGAVQAEIQLQEDASKLAAGRMDIGTGAPVLVFASGWGSTRAHTTCCAIWQSLFAALHFLGERVRGFLPCPFQNFLAHFVYDGLLPSTFLTPPQRCQPLVRATGNLTHQG